MRLSHLLAACCLPAVLCTAALAVEPPATFNPILSALSSNPYSANHRRIRFGVSIVQMNNPYYISMQNALKHAIGSIGATMVVANARDDFNTQLQDIENMLAQGIDVLIVVPSDVRRIRSAIEKARQAGVVVISLDAQVLGPINSYVGSKNYEAGFKSGDYLANAIDGEGQVAIISTSERQSTTERIRGFMGALANHPQIKVVETISDINESNQAGNITHLLLSKYPGLKGIFTVNDILGLGVYYATLYDHRNVKITSIDGNPNVVKIIATGDSHFIATVAQSPTDQAYAAVGLGIIKYLGAPIQPEFLTDVTLLDFYNARGFSW
ncbi:MAG: substrate-binding domain-containing protein [Succinivibrionaceae bacterium]|nr:substrate-binding domain-containing protein [Succinivibrionaceae bacterium]